MNWRKPETKRLVEAILTLKSATEAQAFMRDLMTEDEILEFAKRFQAAELLTSKVPYSVIVSDTGLSSTTVARVSKWLNGSEGGYRSVIEKLSHHTPVQVRRGLS